ncbi:MAG: type II secretion system F family protein [Phycisphaerales bacterium]|nr:MAG: type II secretion system F family protein [Phycisphaerales bacterium]
MALFASQAMMGTNAQAPVLGAGNDFVIYVLPVIGSMLLFYGIYQVIVETRTSNRKKMQDRLRGKTQKKLDKTPESILRRGGMGQTKSFADAIIGKFSFVPKVQRMLDQGDVSWSASQTLVNLFSIAILLTVALAVFRAGMVAALGCGGGVIVLPMLWLSMRRGRRVRKLANQLPDVFDMMGQALRAGHSLGGAIQLIYEQMPPPIATEFAQVYHEQNLGIKIEDALQAMADRVDSLDVRFFVTAVMIQRQTGGDLAEVLDNISGVIRERIELAGLVRGLTAEGRLSGWVLFAMPILVFAAVMYLNPNYGGIMFENALGKVLLMVAGGMQLMGIAMIRWIVNIKV